MEKIAVIEIKSTSVKLQIVDIARNKYFKVSHVVEMPINLTKDFYADMFVKTTVIKEINNILSVYKKIIEINECTNSICLASDVIAEAKNINGFLDELNVVNGFKFEVVSPENEMNYVYTAIINSFNKPKGLIINIADYNTELIVYNRRNVITKLVIPFGSISAFDKLADKSFEEKESYLIEEINKLITNSDVSINLPEEYEIIACGDSCKDYGVVCRKAKKYPIELAHNFTSSKTDLNKVYALIKGYDTNSLTKIKGLTLQNSKYFPSSMIILKAILDNFDKDSFAISKVGRVEGLLFNEVIPLTLEKPISDTLGYSLQAINDYYDRKPNNSSHIYEIAMVLFKQLKVLHKLPRPYVRVLRIASYLINGGYRIDVDNAERAVFDVIRNSEIYGVTHSDIILAGFVALNKNTDNFNLADWVKYKEYLTDEDLMAVKKLSVILRIAEALDVTGFGSVTDINCDILGDSVIMKTIVQKDSPFEIAYTMLCGSDFKKVFGKNLEVL